MRAAIKFREHRGGLAESMRTQCLVHSLDELRETVILRLAPWEAVIEKLIDRHGLKVAPYGYDERTGWDTHIVTLEGYGVIGFTDGPLS